MAAASTTREVSQQEIDGFKIDEFDAFTATDDQFTVYWAWCEQNPEYSRASDDPDDCQLCGEPMGDEAGCIHGICMQREDFYADCPEGYEIGGES